MENLIFCAVTPSNKAYARRKSMNMGIMVIGILSQPVIRGPYT